MTFKELLEAVKDQNLTKEQCDSYRDSLIHLLSDMRREIADLKKKRAMFFLSSEEKSGVAKTIAWDGTPEGQRLIDLKEWSRAAMSEIEGLKSRIYSLL